MAEQMAQEHQQERLDAKGGMAGTTHDAASCCQPYNPAASVLSAACHAADSCIASSRWLTSPSDRGWYAILLLALLQQAAQQTTWWQK